MKTTLAVALVALLLFGAAEPARAACPPPGWDEASLERLRSDKFQLADPAARSALASALTDCLADPRPQLRDGLLRAAVAYEIGIRDHCGFDAEQGWRHGVAHGADLLQLALNPALGREALDAIVAAVGTQVASAGEHFYVYGESERLARPVYYAAQRGLQDSVWWSAWLAALASPAPLPNWGEAFKTQAGLARKHNTRAFVQVLP